MYPPHPRFVWERDMNEIAARPTQPALREEDECPVCHGALPPKGPDGSEMEREAHVSACVEAHFSTSSPRRSQPPAATAVSAAVAASAATPSQAGGISSHRLRAPLSTPSSAPVLQQRRRTVGMVVYQATEKDCVGENGEGEAECVICFEEFSVGDEMGRLECLCKFHKVRSAVVGPVSTRSYAVLTIVLSTDLYSPVVGHERSRVLPGSPTTGRNMIAEYCKSRPCLMSLRAFLVYGYEDLGDSHTHVMIDDWSIWFSEGWFWLIRGRVMRSDDDFTLIMIMPVIYKSISMLGLVFDIYSPSQFIPLSFVFALDERHSPAATNRTSRKNRKKYAKQASARIVQRFDRWRVG